MDEPTNSYALPISRNYINHWGIQEALRELLQNAIDAEGGFDVEIAGNTLIISNPDSDLAAPDLVLGNSSKQDDDSKIGKFGEGFKLALSVLARENRQVVVYNGSSTWLPIYKYSDLYQTEILHIDEFDMPSRDGESGLSFVIRNMSDEEIAELRQNCLHIRGVGKCHETSRGQILLEEAGYLYVNGLFVCKTELKYGYNISPEYLQLERDRQTVSAFNLKFETAAMWREVGDVESVARDMAEDVSDVEYVGSYQTDIADACAKHFTEEFGDATPVANQRDANEIISSGGKAAVVSHAYAEQVKSAPSWTNKFAASPVPTPAEELESFLKINRKHMRRSGIVAFKELINSSKSWKRG